MTVGQPPLVVKLVVELGGSALVFQCDRIGYNSTTYTPILYLAFTSNISYPLNYDVIISYMSPSAYLAPKLAVRTRLACVDVFEDSGCSDLPNGANSILGLADSSMSFVKSLEALVKAFVRKAQRKAVYPFRDCFSYKSFGGKSLLGKKTPVISFVLGGGAKWDIYGTNSLVMAVPALRGSGRSNGVRPSDS
ncbi:hypothetical protein YC2023_016349 [Brassica napus]